MLRHPPGMHSARTLHPSQLNPPGSQLDATRLPACGFTLGWSLPPSLGCNLKQPDSEAGLVNHLTCLNLHPYGPLTLYGPNPVMPYSMLDFEWSDGPASRPTHHIA
nr:hypothetical transcript [Hymenolepis microstoma]